MNKELTYKQDLKLRRQLLLSIYSVGVFMGMFACITTLWFAGYNMGFAVIMSIAGALGSLTWARIVKKSLGWKNVKR